MRLRDADSLVGLPYVDGEFDCMHLAALAQKRLFGRTVHWHGEHPISGRAQVATIERNRDESAFRVDEAENGDALLFVQSTGYHIGTVLIENGQRWVLHTNATAGYSVMEPLHEVLRTSQLEGYWRWKS